MKRFGDRGLLVFVLFWSTFVVVVDYSITSDALKRLYSRSFQPIECAVERTIINESCDDGDCSYVVRVDYSYSVNGRTYTNNQMYAGSRVWMSRPRADAMAACFPVGQKSMAYFPPRHPERAVLIRGFAGDELLGALPLMPFNLIAIMLWPWYLGTTPRGSSMRLAAMRLRLERKIQVHSAGVRPSVVAAIAMSIVSPMAWGVIWGIYGPFASLRIVLFGWCITILVGVVTLLWRKYVERSSGKSFVWDNANECLTLPATCGRPRPRTIKVNEIVAVAVKEVWPVPRESDSCPDYYPAIYLADGTEHLVAEWSDIDKAEAFVSSLKDRLQLPDKQTSAKV